MEVNWLYSQQFCSVNKLEQSNNSYKILIGAFVAGLDAGLVYNSWPKYSGKWIPHELMARDIFGIDEFFSNPVSVQFLHRNLVKFLQY